VHSPRSPQRALEICLRKDTIIRLLRGIPKANPLIKQNAPLFQFIPHPAFPNATRKRSPKHRQLTDEIPVGLSIPPLPAPLTHIVAAARPRLSDVRRKRRGLPVKAGAY
jgi:hypothetical protein